MEEIADLLDLTVGVLQTSAVLFLAYGAYLAIRKRGGPKISNQPGEVPSHPDELLE
jgi:hypothetical protein